MPTQFSHAPDETFIFRRKSFETFSISLSKQVNPNISIGEFFSEPIQIGVLHLTPNRVKLGIHAHPMLDICLDGFIDDAWQKQMKNEPI